MGDSYSFIANSGWMAILCGIVIIFVMVQSALFFRAAWRRSEELGIDKEARKKIVKSSAVFSIVPSLPILISYVILMSALGRFFRGFGSVSSVRQLMRQCQPIWQSRQPGTIVYQAVTLHRYLRHDYVGSYPGHHAVKPGGSDTEKIRQKDAVIKQQ